jgi:hypothetical protein
MGPQNGSAQRFLGEAESTTEALPSPRKRASYWRKRARTAEDRLALAQCEKEVLAELIVQLQGGLTVKEKQLFKSSKQKLSLRRWCIFFGVAAVVILGFALGGVIARGEEPKRMAWNASVAMGECQECINYEPEVRSSLKMNGCSATVIGDPEKLRSCDYVLVVTAGHCVNSKGDKRQFYNPDGETGFYGWCIAVNRQIDAALFVAQADKVLGCVPIVNNGEFGNDAVWSSCNYPQGYGPNFKLVKFSGRSGRDGATEGNSFWCDDVSLKHGARTGPGHSGGGMFVAKPGDNDWEYFGITTHGTNNGNLITGLHRDLYQFIEKEYPPCRHDDDDDDCRRYCPPHKPRQPSVPEPPEDPGGKPKPPWYKPNVPVPPKVPPEVAPPPPDDKVPAPPPPPVLKGEKGDKGDKGDPGTQGPPGKGVDPEQLAGLISRISELEKVVSDQKAAITVIQQQLQSITVRSDDLQTAVEKEKRRIIYVTAADDERTKQTDLIAADLKQRGYPLTVMTLKPKLTDTQGVPGVYVVATKQSVIGADNVITYLSSLTL